MPHLAGISLYPIKSLGPVRVSEAALVASGALRHDREFAIFDAEGKFVNGKRNSLVHGLRSAFDPAIGSLCLAEKHFHWPDDQAEIDVWLSAYFGQSVVLSRHCEGGFPDDLNAPGPTIISTATLEAVASWFPGLSVDSARIRFRANLEIGGVPAFWEDHLFGEPETVVPFQIGPVAFHGMNPCQRCVVPPRDPATGEAIPEFSQIFRERREATLPAWANRARFNHFYRLAINTRVPEAETGKMLRLGDEIRLL